LTNVSTTEDGNEVTTYSFKVKNKYGVAFYCVNDNEGQVYQLTKDDLSSVTYFCEDHTTRYTVSGSFGNLQEDVGLVFIDSQSNMSILGSTVFDPNVWSVSDVPEGTWDIVGVEFTTEGDSITPTRAAIERDVEVNQNITGKVLSFVDNSLAGSYVFIGANSDTSKIRMESIDASSAPKDAWNMDLSNINPLTSGSFDPNTKTISGLDYNLNPEGKAKNLLGYNVSIDNDVDWSFAISKNWLGEGTSYTLPDFSEVDGFDDSWWFSDLANTDVELTVVASDNIPLSDLLKPSAEIEGEFPLSKSGILEMVSQDLQ